MNEQLIIITETQLKDFAKKNYQKGYLQGKNDLKQFLEDQIKELEIIKLKYTQA